MPDKIEDQEIKEEEVPKPDIFASSLEKPPPAGGIFGEKQTILRKSDFQIQLAEKAQNLSSTEKQDLLEHIQSNCECDIFLQNNEICISVGDESEKLVHLLSFIHDCLNVIESADLPEAWQNKIEMLF